MHLLQWSKPPIPAQLRPTAITMFNAIGALMLAGMLANEPRCVRWTWTGDVYNRRVVCLEWQKKEKEKQKEEKKK